MNKILFFKISNGNIIILTLVAAKQVMGQKETQVKLVFPYCEHLAIRFLTLSDSSCGARYRSGHSEGVSQESEPCERKTDQPMNSEFNIRSL